MKKFIFLLLIVISLIYIFPIAYTITNSFMTIAQTTHNSIEMVPDQFNLQQYYSLVMYKEAYFRFFLTSVKLTVSIIVGQMLVSVPAAFALAKMKFTGSNVILIIYILATLLPFQVTLVPNYLIFDMANRLLHIQILDTHLSLILPGIFSTFGVFFLRQFMGKIPNEIIEYAKIDGADNLTILLRIILPILKPALYVITLLTFIDNWNLIEQAIIFIDTASKLPLSVYLENIFYNDHDVFFAASVLYMIPAIVVILKGEKYLKEIISIGGITHGQ